MRRFVCLLLFLVTLITVWIGAGLANIVAAGTTPILLVVNNAAPNPYGRYLGEILRAEGLNAFTTVELATLNSITLNAADLVVLAETPLSAAQASLFNSYIAGGGRLVAMRPDQQLNAALGLEPAGYQDRYGQQQRRRLERDDAAVSWRGAQLSPGERRDFTGGAVQQ
jgi:hypothetical protein